MKASLYFGFNLRALVTSEAARSSSPQTFKDALLPTCFRNIWMHFRRSSASHRPVSSPPTAPDATFRGNNPPLCSTATVWLLFPLPTFANNFSLFSSHLSLSLSLLRSAAFPRKPLSTVEGFHGNAARHAAGQRVTRDSLRLAAIGPPSRFHRSSRLAGSVFRANGVY